MFLYSFQNAKLEQALSLRQAQEQEEQMSKLSSLQLTPDQSTQQQESDNKDDDFTWGSCGIPGQWV